MVNELMNNHTSLIYYAHIPVMAVSLLMGFFIFLQARKDVSSKYFFIFSLTFFVYTLLNFIAWVSHDSRLIMFVWSALGLVTTLVYIFGFLFLYTFVTKRHVPFFLKLIFSALVFPLIWFESSDLNLVGFDFDYCYAVDNLYGGYVFIPQALSIAALIGFGLVQYFRNKQINRRETLVLFVALISFFIVFFGGGYIADNYELYSLEIYGLFAMVLFLAILAYIIVRYQAFHIRLFGAQALVVGLVILIGAQFTFIKNPTNMMLNGIAFLLVIIFGFILVRSVKHEIDQHEQALQLAADLQRVNSKLSELDKQKSEFLSIAAHQLRTPLSIIKGYISLIQDGAYGKPTAKMNPILQNIEVSNERLVKLVDEFLDVSRLEQGRTQYSFGAANLSVLLDGVVTELTAKAEAKQIVLKVLKEGEIPSTLIADEERLRHGVFNYIDNAIKYSPEKSTITITLAYRDGRVVYSVKDQGVGLDQFDIQNLFQKFYRSPKVLRDFQGTGLGLYVVKEFVEAHGGEVYVKSDGIGKGSEFGFWIPLIPTGEIYETWKNGRAPELGEKK